jgi:hypothetical protein
MHPEKSRFVYKNKIVLFNDDWSMLKVCPDRFEQADWPKFETLNIKLTSEHKSFES